LCSEASVLLRQISRQVRESVLQDSISNR
jgi:hypothetical protein